MKPLTFYIGEESRPKIEKIADIPTSLFSEQYRQSFKIMAAYLQNSSVETKKETNNEHFNNIFAYIGERGSGKTSCMLSVANMLIDKEPNLYAKYTQEKELQAIKGKKYHQIDLIDPSFFDMQHNILELVVAQLFKKFNEDAKKRNQPTEVGYTNNKRELLDCFQDTHKKLKQFLGTANPYTDTTDDSLEQLVALAAAVDLRQSMGGLIEAYLRYFGHDILLVAVDDIDLHTRHAYSMVEQLRKYLIHPAVMVLISVKLDQLALVMRQQYAKEFKPLLESSKDSMSMTQIDEMVDRYLGKLIPHGQRIFLPEIEVFYERGLEIHIRDKDKKTEADEPTKKEGQKDLSTVRHVVTSLIFKKTRYLFYHTKLRTSYIVPNNLRELRHLIKMLHEMPDYSYSTSEETRPRYNQLAFKKYLFETWTANNLTQEGQRIIQELMKVTDAALFNKAVLRLLDSQFKLSSRFDQGKKDLDKSESTNNNLDSDQDPSLFLKADFEELIRILDDNNVAYNISLGDVMAVLAYIDRITPWRHDHKLLFAIKSMYSIRLYEYYNQMTAEKTDNVSGTANQPSEGQSKEMTREEVSDSYFNYHKLVGGNFMNTAVLDIIQPTSTKKSRSQRPINISNIKVIIKQLEEGKLESGQLDSTKTYGGLLLEQALQLVEFCALTTSRRWYSKTDYTYRKGKGIYYDENLTAYNAQNVMFDIGAVFYNITCIQQAYHRFSPKLYQWAFNTDGSILRQLRRELIPPRIDHEHDSAEIRLLSWTCMRNVEVLDQLVQKLVRDKRKGGEAVGEVFSDFFEQAHKFEIATYDRDEQKEKNRTIGLSFLKILKRVLDDSEVKAAWNTIFDSKNEPNDTSDQREGNELDTSLIKVLSDKLYTGVKTRTGSVIKENIIKEVGHDNLFFNASFTDKRSYNISEFYKVLNRLRSDQSHRDNIPAPIGDTIQNTPSTADSQTRDFATASPNNLENLDSNKVTDTEEKSDTKPDAADATTPTTPNTADSQSQDESTQQTV